MTDYERGVEQATEVYKEVIREYVAENVKLRVLVQELLTDPDAWDYDYFKWRIHELGVEVGG